MDPTPIEVFEQHKRDMTKPTFVFFFAEWCPYCRKVKPEWIQLQKELKSNVHMDVIDVDSIQTSKQQEWFSAQNVRSFPTLRLYLKGQMYAYAGDRTKHDMSKFICSHVRSCPWVR